MDERISASEVNRFCYCPHQWYYERAYGPAELNRLRRERNEALGLTGPYETGEDLFQRGRDFHRSYRHNDRLRRRRRLVAALLLTAVLLLGLWWWLGYA